VLDHLPQRADRLRHAGAGPRLAESEQHRHPFAFRGRFLDRAREQRRRAGGIAERQRVVGRPPQQRGHVRVGDRLGLHHLRGDLARRGAARRSRSVHHAAWCRRSRSAGEMSS
jgi:hypothetical protein